MDTKKGEKIKIYLVFGLALILMISAYFRFIKPKIKAGRVAAPAAGAAPAQFQIPRIKPAVLQDTPDSPSPIKDDLQAVVRDIFMPMGSPLKAADPPPPEVKIIKPPPSMTLRGTIVGKKSSIAIIDNQFLRPGDRIDGYRVARIGKKDVILYSGDRKIRLEILKNE